MTDLLKLQQTASYNERFAQNSGTIHRHVSAAIFANFGALQLRTVAGSAGRSGCEKCPQFQFKILSCQHPSKPSTLIWCAEHVTERVFGCWFRLGIDGIRFRNSRGDRRTDASTNQVRDEFRKNFTCPVILWVTDDIVTKMIRLAPDFKSWAAATIKFELAVDELIHFLTARADTIFKVGELDRELGSSIPALAMRNGRCDMSFGVMGAHYQPMGHVQIVTNMVDYGMDVQQAIDAPRFFFEGEKTDVERGTPAATIEGLKARGHDVVMASSPWGGAQTIKIDWDRGVLIGGSEPRKDGCALGY